MRKKIMRVPGDEVLLPDNEEMDIVYQEGYRRIPEDTALAEAQEKLIGEIIGEESW